LATLAAGALLLTIVGPATAHRRPSRFWTYEKPIRRHRTWDAHPSLRAAHTEWHDQHSITTTQEVTNEDGSTSTTTTQEPAYAEEEHGGFHHYLYHRHLKRGHRYRIVARQRGKASWYDYRGQVGACGKVLRGAYAAHRTWPCGTKVAVRKGRKVVRVRVLDRGPFVDGWIIDLSPRAFRKLASPGAGVISVKIYRLKKRR
jgi:rare lipoprotein A (peptidoglycan hydrolase)